MQRTKQFLRKEKWENLDFWKTQSQNGVGELSRNDAKTSLLDSKVWLQRPLEFFLRIVRPCWRNLKCPPNLDLYVREKIRTVQRIKQFLRKEKWEKLDFWNIQSQNGVGELSMDSELLPLHFEKIEIFSISCRKKCSNAP